MWKSEYRWEGGIVQVKVKMVCCDKNLVTEFTAHLTIEKGDHISIGKCPLCGTRNAAGMVIDI